MYTQSGNANSNQYKNGGNSGDSLKVGLITKHTQNDKSYSMLNLPYLQTIFQPKHFKYSVIFFFEKQVIIFSPK